MSVRAYGAVWAGSTLNRSHGAFLLLLAIAEHAGDDGVAWPGPERLVRLLGFTDRHLRRCVEAAEAAGELQVRQAVNGTKVYRLTFPGLEDVDAARLARQGLKLDEPFGTPSPDAGVRQGSKRKRTRMSEKPDAGVRPTRARSSSGTVKEPSASGGSPPAGATATAQTLVAFYVDEMRRRGVEPISRLVGHMGREVKQLLSEGVKPDEVQAGIAHFIQRGLTHPSALASCVQERRLRKPRPRGGGDDRFAAYDAGL